MLSFVYFLSILHKITITNHENSTHLSFFSLFPFHLSVNRYIPKVCDVFQEITAPYDYKKLGRSQIMNQMDSLNFENILKRFSFISFQNLTTFKRTQSNRKFRKEGCEIHLSRAKAK